MSQVTSDTPFVKKLKKFLKIKPRVKNKDYSAKTGQTPKSGIGKKKMSSFREDTAANKKLQQETKDPNRTTVSYKRVTSKNKDKLSDQQKVKPKNTDTKNKKKKSKTPTDRIRVKGGRLLSIRSVEGRRAANRQKAREKAQAAARKRLGK